MVWKLIEKTVFFFNFSKKKVYGPNNAMPGYISLIWYVYFRDSIMIFDYKKVFCYLIMLNLEYR